MDESELPGEDEELSLIHTLQKPLEEKNSMNVCHFIQNQTNTQKLFKKEREPQIEEWRGKKWREIKQYINSFIQEDDIVFINCKSKGHTKTKQNGLHSIQYYVKSYIVED